MTMLRALIVIWFLLLSAVGGGVAHAQTSGCTAAGAACTYTSANDGTCTVSPDTGELYCRPNSLPFTPDSASSKIAVPTKGFSDSGGLLANVMTWIASLFAMLVGAAMITLNYAVYYTVIKMGSYVNNLAAVGITWRILRDFGNITLIFGFLAAGIMTILDTEWYGWGTKMLPKLLLAAIFINFSLFFAETIVDAGNLFATQIYTQINGGALPTQAQLSDESISGTIMQQLGLQKIYGAVQSNPAALFEKNSLFIGFMSIILFIVVAFVLFSLAFMFIARFVVLIVLIIVAPIGFAGWAMPKLKSVSDKWWSQLAEQTLTAPVLLLLLYIALAVITDAQFLSFGGSPDWLGLIDSGGNLNITGYAAVLLSFLVAMGLLLVVLTVAKSMSAAGAGWATQTAGKLSFGTTAWLARNTAGRAGYRLGNMVKKTRLATVPIVGTGLVKGLDKVGAASFDVRGSKAASAGLKLAKTEAGTPEKGGFAAQNEAAVKARTEYAEKKIKGKDLSKDEQAIHQELSSELGEHRKDLGKAIVERRKIEATGDAEALRTHDAKIQGIRNDIAAKEKEVEEMERDTAKGRQRQYASNLEMGYTWLGQEPLVKFFNTTNIEAAKKIRDAAKKSDDDKTLDAIKKAVAKAAKEEGGATPPPAGAAPGASSGGGAAPAAPAGGAPAGGGGGH